MRPKNYKSVLFFAAVGSLLLLHLTAAFNHQLITDEYETIATARFVSEGKVIFKHFFQHHGPLSYYIYSVFFIFLKDIALVIYAMKILSCAFLCIILILLYLMTKKISGTEYSPWIGFIPVFVLLNDIIWWRYAAQIRTDPLMILFLMLCFYFFYLYHHKNLARYLVLAGFFSSAAFFTKQSGIIIILLFTIFYFRLNIKKYIVFLAGSIPVLLGLALYFFSHQALPRLFRGTVWWNRRSVSVTQDKPLSVLTNELLPYLQSPSGTFTLRERAWCIFSTATPLYIKGIYLIGGILFIAISFYFYKEARRKGGRFFVALFYAALLSLMVIFCMKAPYPQHLMPVQIILYLLGVYYLVLLKRYKKIWLSLCAGIIFAMLAVTNYYFKDISTHKITLAEQTAAVKKLAQPLSKSLKALGAMPVFLVCEPSDFIWYYPPAFVELRSPERLVKRLERADIVFYDTTLYSVAPRKFKLTLFNEWHFITRFYFPFSALGRHDAISVFIKDRERLGEGAERLKDIDLKKIGQPLNLLDRPIYIPVYCKAELLTEKGKMTVDGKDFEYRSENIENLKLSILISTDKSYFDDLTNSVYPNRPVIKYAKIPEGLIFEVPYQETRSIKPTTWMGSIGLRSVPGNRPGYKGIIKLIYNRLPDDIRITELKSGYRLELDFFARDLSLKIDAYEEEMQAE